MNITNESFSTKWIENLALEELNIEESGVIHFHSHFSQEAQIEASSIDLMEDMRELFEIYATKFNQFRSDSTNQKAIKIFKISNTVNDFMLFRNSLKLVVSRRSHDTIAVGLVTNSSSFGALKTSMNSVPHLESIQEIKAHVGPFGDISWRYQNEIVNKDALVRYYLTEFIRNSAQ